MAKEAAKETIKETVSGEYADTMGIGEGHELGGMAIDTNNLKEASDSQLNLAIQFINEALANKPSPDIEYIAC